MNFFIYKSSFLHVAFSDVFVMLSCRFVAADAVRCPSASPVNAPYAHEIT